MTGFRRGFIQPASLASAFDATAVTFDGNTARLHRGARLTGLSNTYTTFMASVWVRSLDNAKIQKVFSSDEYVNSMMIRQDTTGIFQYQATELTSSGTIGLRLYSTSVVPVGLWAHLLLSVDVTDAAKCKLYLNDVSDINLSTRTGNALNFNNGTYTDNYGVASDPTSTQEEFLGDMAELWWAPGQWLDLDVEANRRKFIGADGKPVNLGSSGEIPTGVAPVVFLSGALASWHTNKGTGGGFTKVGTLTEAPTSPSD